MGNKKIGKKDIEKLLNEWSQEFMVSLPSREDGVAAMVPWDGKDTGFIDWYRNTVVPPKAGFLPPLEEMFRFRKDGDGYRMELPAAEEKGQLVFGIRPCDANALTILDINFKDGYEDPYYLSRRNNAVLVGLVCANPYDSCFCTSLESGPADAANVDLLLTDIGDELLIEAVTDKGKELMSRTSLAEDATEADEARAEEAKQTARAKVTRRVEVEDIDRKLLACFEDEDHWEKVAAKCISCGICTLLCPTCYCFDINDELVNKQGVRFRCWDSCGFCDYTKMPVENPREEKWRRVRQKVAHKYEFYPMNFDTIACTGCGNDGYEYWPEGRISRPGECLPAAHSGNR
jgi:ferredoxin